MIQQYIKVIKSIKKILVSKNLKKIISIVKLSIETNLAFKYLLKQNLCYLQLQQNKCWCGINSKADNLGFAAMASN